jgi:hypothetical protein
MFAIIGIVAWVILGLPIVYSPDFRGNVGDFLKADWFVAAFTGLLAFVTYRLVTSTNRLWQETRRAATKQEQDTRILQRAYISVEPQGIEPFLDGSDRLVPSVSIRNAGNLPAAHVSWSIHREISSDPRRVDFKTEVQEGNIVLAPRMLARKGGKHLTLSELLSVKPTPQQSKEHWIYVWGRVEYHDGFQGNRFIEFCHRYNVSAADQRGKIDAATGRYHEHGNRTDEG